MKYRTMKRACVQVIRPTRQAEADVETESDTGSRLINPEEYEPLLPTTEKHTAAEFTEDDPVNERLISVYTYGSIS